MFKVGDFVVVKEEATISQLDYETQMRGNTYKILRTSIGDGQRLNVLLDYRGGWWVASEALELTNSLQRICAKVAFMNKRFEER